MKLPLMSHLTERARVLLTAAFVIICISGRAGAQSDVYSSFPCASYQTFWFESNQSHAEYTA